jgi:hypothetical protein
MNVRTEPLRPGPVPGVQCGRLAGADALNAALAQAVDSLWDAPDTRRTHQVNGRFENIYITLERLPEARPVLEAAGTYARRILGRRDLRLGFWLNRMAPGELTGLHTHEEDDELLSGVYYVEVPPDSGRLLLHLGGKEHAVAPSAGDFCFFAPAVPHAVETNAGEGIRLSLAFNVGVDTNACSD